MLGACAQCSGQLQLQTDPQHGTGRGSQASAAREGLRLGDEVLKLNSAGGGTAAAHGANALLERLWGQRRPWGQAFPCRRTES